MKFKFLEHTADIKFQAFGKTLEEVFENSALAMFNAMYNKNINCNLIKKIKVEGDNLENLLYNFLEELLFLMDSEGFFLSEIKELKISENGLTAVLVGDRAKNYKISLDIKAITYNEMFIYKKNKGNWVAQVVVDV